MNGNVQREGPVLNMEAALDQSTRSGAESSWDGQNLNSECKFVRQQRKENRYHWGHHHEASQGCMFFEANFRF